MKLNEMRTIIAITHGIQTDKISKIELIQIVQTVEGNFGCFATAHGGECDQSGCHWRKDCLETARLAAFHGTSL